MVKLGITGTVTFENKIKIKNLIHKIKQELNEDVIIIGLGDKQGADKYIRKYAVIINRSLCDCSVSKIL